MRRFRNRLEAGRELAAHLLEYRDRGDVVVLGLPRGGVPVAGEVAAGLGAPLDVLVVRKLGLPGQAELAMGALAGGGIRVLNDELVEQLAIPEATIEAVASRESAELERRERVYRGDRPRLELAGKVVVLVDDGLATGSTMHAAVRAVRTQAPASVVVAVPTAPPQTCAWLARVADEVVCLSKPYPFYAVGLSYEDFSEVGDDDVRRLLTGSEARW